MTRLVPAAAALAACLWGLPALAAGDSCSAVVMHGIPPGAAEGSQAEAGLYNAHFGRITVDGTVKNGKPIDYTITVKDQTLPAAAALPAGIEDCLKAKGVPVPTAAAPQDCPGEKLKLVIVPQGAKRMLVLYAGLGKSWSYCRTSLWGG